MLEGREERSWRDHIEVVQRLCKGRPAGIDPAAVAPGLYVLDWKPGRPGDYDSVNVHRVEGVEGDVVRCETCYVMLADFAASVVAGPFAG